MKTQHTPGPWNVRNTGTSIGVFGRNGTEQVHCDRNTPQQESNARLIASAPELLEALKALLEADQAIERASDLLPGDRSRNRFNAMMRASTAIAKAKGETL